MKKLIALVLLLPILARAQTKVFVPEDSLRARAAALSAQLNNKVDSDDFVAAVLAKADTGTTNTAIRAMAAQMATKASAADVYTKAQADGMAQAMTATETTSHALLLDSIAKLRTRLQASYDTTAALRLALNSYVKGPLNFSMLVAALGLTPIDLAAARAALTVTTTGIGAATYNSATGVFNVPTPATGGYVSLGNVTLTQTATVAISAGKRQVTLSAPGALAGDRLLITPASTLPAGYDVTTATCAVAGQIVVTVDAPLLAIGASYSIPCKLTAIR